MLTNLESILFADDAISLRYVERRSKTGLTSFTSVIRSFAVDGFRRFVSGSEVPVVDYAGKKTVSSAQQQSGSDLSLLLAIHGFPP